MQQYHKTAPRVPAYSRKSRPSDTSVRLNNSHFILAKSHLITISHLVSSHIDRAIENNTIAETESNRAQTQTLISRYLLHFYSSRARRDFTYSNKTRSPTSVSNVLSFVNRLFPCVLSSRSCIYRSSLLMLLYQTCRPRHNNL